MILQPKTWLFVPANQPKLVENALRTRAEALILDLEDSVPDTEKSGARERLLQIAPALRGRNVWVRVNGHGSSWHADDLLAVRELEEISGFFLPKTENTADLPSPETLIRPHAPALKLGLLIESARGVLNLHGLLDARPDINTVMFGGAQGADLMTDLGCGWSIDGPELLHARQHTLLAIRAAKNVQAVDGVFSTIDDLDGLGYDTHLSRRLGYRARAVIHPKQIDCVNAVYAPQPEELAWAHRVNETFAEALNRGVAAIRVDGKMIDYAMYKLARRILESAT